MNVAWLPLAVFTIAQGEFLASRDAQSFLPDLAVQSSYLIGLPLFIVAESLLASRLRDIVQHFVDVGIVRMEDHARFDTLVTDAKRRVGSMLAEFAAVGLQLRWRISRMNLARVAARVQPDLGAREADLRQARTDRRASRDERGASGRAALLAVPVCEHRAFIADAIDVRVR